MARPSLTYADEIAGIRRSGLDGDRRGHRPARVEQGYLITGGEIERLTARESSDDFLAIGIDHVRFAADGDRTVRGHPDLAALLVSRTDQEPLGAGLHLPRLGVQRVERET